MRRMRVTRVATLYDKTAQTSGDIMLMYELRLGWQQNEVIFVPERLPPPSSDTVIAEVCSML